MKHGRSDYDEAILDYRWELDGPKGDPIPADEPVLLLRGQDRLAWRAALWYADNAMIGARGSVEERVRDSMRIQAHAMKAWAAAHGKPADIPSLADGVRIGSDPPPEEDTRVVPEGWEDLDELDIATGRLDHDRPGARALFEAWSEAGQGRSMYDDLVKAIAVLPPTIGVDVASGADRGTGGTPMSGGQRLFETGGRRQLEAGMLRLGGPAGMTALGEKRSAEAGWGSIDELLAAVGGLDLSGPGAAVAYEKWKLEDGTKDGFARLVTDLSKLPIRSTTVGVAVKLAALMGEISDEDLAKRGWSSRSELLEALVAVDLDDPEIQAAFEKWRDGDGSKAGWIYVTDTASGPADVIECPAGWESVEAFAAALEEIKHRAGEEPKILSMISTWQSAGDLSKASFAALAASIGE